MQRNLSKRAYEKKRKEIRTKKDASCDTDIWHQMILESAKMIQQIDLFLPEKHCLIPCTCPVRE